MQKIMRLEDLQLIVAQMIERLPQLDADEVTAAIEDLRRAMKAADFDIPELWVPVVSFACPDCPGSVITWHRGVAICGDCGRSSAD
jgi:hypothetical protein